MLSGGLLLPVKPKLFSSSMTQSADMIWLQMFTKSCCFEKTNIAKTIDVLFTLL